MKKLILSAVFALVCFSAQASSEVIRNDDKKPKAKAKLITNVIPNLQHCATRSVQVSCPYGAPFYTISATRCSFVSAADAGLAANAVIYSEAFAACGID